MKKESEPAGAGPLDSLPEIKLAWVKLLDLGSAAFGKAWKPPETTKQTHKVQNVIRLLHERDGYSEAEILATLRWWLTSDAPDAIWWRENGCKSLGSLRDRRGDKPTKFAQMHEKAQKSRERNGAAERQYDYSAADHPAWSTPNDEARHRFNDAMRLLREKIGDDSFQTWFHDAWFVGWDGDDAVLGVRDAGARNWVASNYIEHVRGALEAAFGRPVEVVFEINEEAVAQ